MKKIIILIITTFFITGCYDNIELNNMDIITCVGIDYKDDNYIVSFEALNSEKSTDSITMKSFIETGAGSTISEAFNSASRKLSKRPYFAHLKVVLLSDNIENDILKEVSEYLIRQNNIRDEFYLVVTYDEPKNVLESTTNSNPVVGLDIMNMLENSRFDNNIGLTNTFEKNLSNLLTSRKDMVISTIKTNGKKITLTGGTTYNNYKLVDRLTIKETSLYNLLTNNTKGSLFNKKYNKDLLSINIYNSKIKYLLNKDGNIEIKGNLKGLIVDNTLNVNLKEIKTYNELNKEFKFIIENDIKDLIKKLQKDKTDILGFTNTYYKKYGKYSNKIWLNADIKINIDLKINKKGIVFEVER